MIAPLPKPKKSLVYKIRSRLFKKRSSKHDGLKLSTSESSLDVLDSPLDATPETCLSLPEDLDRLSGLNCITALPRPGFVCFSEEDITTTELEVLVSHEQQNVGDDKASVKEQVEDKTSDLGLIVEDQETEEQTIEEQTTEDQATNVTTNEEQTNEDQTNEDQTTNVTTNEEQTNEEQTTEDQATEDQTTADQTTEDQTTNVTTNEEQTIEEQTTEYQTTEDQTTEDQTTEDQTTDLGGIESGTVVVSCSQESGSESPGLMKEYHSESDDDDTDGSAGEVDEADPQNDIETNKEVEGARFLVFPVDEPLLLVDPSLNDTVDDGQEEDDGVVFIDTTQTIFPIYSKEAGQLELEVFKTPNFQSTEELRDDNEDGVENEDDDLTVIEENEDDEVTAIEVTIQDTSPDNLSCCSGNGFENLDEEDVFTGSPEEPTLIPHSLSSPSLWSVFLNEESWSDGEFLELPAPVREIWSDDQELFGIIKLLSKWGRYNVIIEGTIDVSEIIEDHIFFLSNRHEKEVNGGCMRCPSRSPSSPDDSENGGKMELECIVLGTDDSIAEMGLECIVVGRCLEAYRNQKLLQCNPGQQKSLFCGNCKNVHVIEILQI